ncbi:MAG: DUF4397 domain-containing protein, partial [Clostridiaceae bacterium]
AVDVYANDKIIAKNLAFSNFTEYIPVTKGMYNIKVYAVGTTKNPVIDQDVFLPGYKIFTIAAIGKLENISLKSISDTRKILKPGKSMVRFIHLSPNAPEVDVTLPDGKIVFDNVSYKEVTDYLEIEPGLYRFDVKLSSNGDNVLTVPNVRLKSDKIYSIYAIGLAGDEPALQVVIPLDGNTYLKF